MQGQQNIKNKKVLYFFVYSSRCSWHFPQKLN